MKLPSVEWEPPPSPQGQSGFRWDLPGHMCRGLIPACRGHGDAVPAFCFRSSTPVGRGKARVGWLQLKTAHFPLYSVHSGLTPPKRSRGKPALSRVPFLEGVNGDSDHSGSGEETVEAELGKQMF